MSTISPEIQSLIDREMAVGNYASEEDVLRQAMEALRSEREALCSDEEETLAGIRRGLADIAAGRSKTLEEFDRDFRARKGIGGFGQNDTG